MPYKMETSKAVQVFALDHSLGRKSSILQPKKFSLQHIKPFNLSLRFIMCHLIDHVIIVINKSTSFSIYKFQRVHGVLDPYHPVQMIQEPCESMLQLDLITRVTFYLGSRHKIFRYVSFYIEKCNLRG